MLNYQTQNVTSVHETGVPRSEMKKSGRRTIVGLTRAVPKGEMLLSSWGTRTGNHFHIEIIFTHNGDICNLTFNRKGGQS